MDGFSGFKTAAGEEPPDAVTVMDPFHVVRLAGDALDQCRRRIQRDSLGQRGREDDALYKARRTLHTGAGLLTEGQRERLEELFANDQHVDVEATWGIYQRMVTAYREPDPGLGKLVMQSVIDSLASGVPTALVELRRLGRTLKQRATDVLAFFDRPPLPATDPHRRSTTARAPPRPGPGAPETRPTTSPARHLRPADSDPTHMR